MQVLIVALLFHFMLFFWSFKRPEILIVYIAFFFQSTDTLLDGVGIYSGRMLIRLLIVLWVLMISYMKSGRKAISITPMLRSKFSMGYLLLIVVGLISISYSPMYISDKLMHIRNMIIYNFIPMSLFLVLFRKNESFERIPIQVAILSLITAFIIIGYGDISNLVIGDRLTLYESVGIESIGLSRLAVFVFVVSFFSLINTKGLRTKLPFILSLMLSIYVMLLSAQRGPIVGLGVGMLFWVVFKSGLKTKLRSLVALVIVVMVTLTFNIDQFGVTDRFDDLRNYETYARYDDFPRTHALFLESPILGHGVKGYFEKTGRVYPHNIFLEVIAEYGVVGLAILMIMLGEIFKWIMSILYSTRSESYKMALAMAWIALFVSSQFSGDLSGNHIFYSVSGLVCSVMIAEKEKGKARETKRWAELSILAQPQKG